MERNLANTNTADARNTTSDIKVSGDPDVWELVCKASSKSQGWMKSTKRMEVPGGWLYLVTTELRSGSGYVTCAETLAFVADGPHASR